MIPIMLLRRSRNHFVTVSPVRKPSALSPASATLIGMAELSLWSTERRSQGKTPELRNITLDWRAECSRNAGTNILLTSGTIILTMDPSVKGWASMLANSRPTTSRATSPGVSCWELRPTTPSPGPADCACWRSISSCSSQPELRSTSSQNSSQPVYISRSSF